MSKKLIVFAVGLPRSGKTTAALATGLPVVQPDAVRLQLHGQAFLPQAEPWIWLLAEALVGALLRAGHESVVFDSCMTTRMRRDEAVAMAKRLGADAAFWPMLTPPGECVRRAREDGREDLVAVIDRMEDSFEMPGEDEPIWEGSSARWPMAWGDGQQPRCATHDAVDGQLG